ncbi:hypothetical protein DFJ74DRAFT_772420 [Hyaloraphidium curvatum]|nr:hypothetical protein DFJ74DRAFT_698132 [Hyaloraphidium curvatum]KAI9010051.1 hypothetical protein DFJ74DRAFT_772420 [Hyaloraphidium curvatum]
MRAAAAVILAALALAAAPARAATIIDGFIPGSGCKVNATAPQLFQANLPTTCQGNVACIPSNATVNYDVTQTCNANAPPSFTLQGSGEYFVVTQWSGATCTGTYLTAAAVIANQCVPLGFIGIPAFGRPACAPGAASGTMAFFGNDACTIPFTGVGTFNVTAGNCGTLSLGPSVFALTAKCAAVVNGSPTIPFAAVTATATTSRPGAGSMVRATLMPVLGAAAAAAAAAMY